MRWSIWVVSVARNAGMRIWRGPDTLRGSYPQQGGDVDLRSVAGNHWRMAGNR